MKPDLNTRGAIRVQDNCNTPCYFVSTKRGWQRYMPPTGAAPFAVKIEGKWSIVYRDVTDAEFFAAHRSSPYRFTVRPLNPDDPWIFRVKITTRGSVAAHDGCDNFDVDGALNHVGGESRRARLKAAAHRMLCDPNLSW